MKFDLHVHTNHSDGIFSPKEVVDMAVMQDLQGIAITDHDNVTGIEIAINYSKKYDNFTVIPGIEISCVHNDEEVHLLGYFIDYKDSRIINLTEKLKSSRLSRGIKMVENINKLGLDLSIEDVKKFSGENYIGRPHIARAMIEKRYVKTLSEAFDKYLDRGKPGYVDRFKISIDETISLIKKIGGISVLAHPGLLKDRSIINYCIQCGIVGIECIHSKHSQTDIDFMLDIAKKNNLIATGGSDFHGDLINGNMLIGKYYINIEDIPEIIGRI